MERATNPAFRRSRRPPTSLFALARRTRSVHPSAACCLFPFVFPSGPTHDQGQSCVEIAAPPRVSRGEESWKRSARLGCDCHPGAGARESEKEKRGRVGEGGGGGRAEEERGAAEERRALGRGEGSASERERSRGGTGRGRGAPGGRVGCGRPEAPASPPTDYTPGRRSFARAQGVRILNFQLSILAGPLQSQKQSPPVQRARGGGGRESLARASGARRGAGAAVAAGGAREANQEAPRAGAREPGLEELRPGATRGQVPARSPSQGAARLVGRRGAARPMPVCGHVLPAGLLVPAVRLVGALLVPRIQHQRHFGAPHG